MSLAFKIQDEDDGVGEGGGIIEVLQPYSCCLFLLQKLSHSNSKYFRKNKSAYFPSPNIPSRPKETYHAQIPVSALLKTRAAAHLPRETYHTQIPVSVLLKTRAAALVPNTNSKWAVPKNTRAALTGLSLSCVLRVFRGSSLILTACEHSLGIQRLTTHAVLT